MIEHNFKKKFGQNFISDKNLLQAIVSDAGVEEDSQVLEIGAGGGSLTETLDAMAKKVVSYEIDLELKDHLLSLPLKHTTFVFGDILKFSLDEIEKDFDKGYKMVANLPYYITSPIIFKFLKSHKLSSLTIMVQKEVATRLVAKSGSKDYGVLSVMTAFYGRAEIKRIVSRNLFYPKPQVDSAIVRIDLNKGDNFDDERFLKFVENIFAMRRKTLKNNLLHAGYDIKKIEAIDGETLSKRAEMFDLEQLKQIYFKIFE